MLHRHRIEKLDSEYRVIERVLEGTLTFDERLPEWHRVSSPEAQRFKAQVEFTVWLADHAGS